MSRIEFTEKQFSRAASTYDEYADTHHKIAAYLVSRTNFPDLSNLVLDIGSGTGILSSELLKTFGKDQIINLDLSHEMLLANKLKSRGSVFVQADMLHLPFRENTFATVVSSTALQWLENAETVAQTISYCLSPGGYFAVAVVISGTFGILTSIRRDILGTPSTGNLSQAERLPTFEKLKTAFKNNSLSLHGAEKHVFMRNYSNVDEPFQAIKNLGISGASERKLSKEEFQELKIRFGNYCEENGLSPYLDYKVGFYWGNKD